LRIAKYFAEKAVISYKNRLFNSGIVNFDHHAGKKIPQMYAGFFNQDSITGQSTDNTYVVKDIFVMGDSLS
jgi:hypothetical protein